MRPQLFVDSDGVFADFDAHIFGLFGQYPREMRDDEMWRRANAHPTFWSDMPLMPGAQEFWNAIKHVNPIVLTGCPKSDYGRAAEAKMLWWTKHFEHQRVITCLSRNKPLYLQNTGDWLVDDMGKNCKKWGAAGGRAIRYTGDWEGALHVLKQEGVV